MKRILIYITFLLFIFALATKANDTIRVQLKWTHQFQFAGFYAAVEQGYYEEEGISVNLIPAGEDKDFVQHVVSAKADIGVESPLLLIERNKGKPVVLLAAIFQHSPEAFITLAKYNINSIEDFPGKTVRISSNDLPSTKALIKQENLSELITLSDTESRIKGLIDGSHQVIDGYSIDLPYQIKKSGYHPVVISPLKYGIDFYGDCIFTSENYLDKNPNQVDAFLKATSKGWHYAMNNKEEIIELIIKKYASQYTRDELINEAREMEGLILPKFVEIGYTHKERWKHIGDTYVSLGLLDADYSLDGYLYEDYQQKRQRRHSRLTFIFIVAFTLLALTLLLVSFFNRKLRREVNKQTKEVLETNQNLRNEIKDRKAIYTDLIETANELKTAKGKAEESDRLKSAFLSNMSHEIRTPMNGIIGFSDLLKEQDLTTDEKKKYIQIIEENSVQLLRIISDIIDISKIEVGELSIQKEPIKIKELFENLYFNFSLKAKEIKGDRINIEYHINSDVDPIINTDPIRLKQILSNLIENAIKFTNKGSITFSVEKENSHYIFTVKDTGIGISQEKLESVFIRFFKDSQQHYNAMGGTGLGLSIAKNMVELLGGKISLSSQTDVGTEFKFTHPS
ncbi:ABC transporter substrate-binding protein [Labilibacter marinus]|uniref:ABC transporter substrate-binding protein n=1 Tax=Labilibacter marinus TaxID=1477105 RepID=UPI000835F07B|nr:ABC transporter substrate-binding protein [Labilibacter marinus]